MQIAVLGKGFIGTYLYEQLQRGAALPHPSVVSLHEKKIETEADVVTLFDGIETPDIVINAIGITGTPNVDWCEDHIDETMFVNASIPVWLAREAWKRGAVFMQISSGCIFDGFDHDFRPEEMGTFTGSTYSASKIKAEEDLQKLHAEMSGSRLEMHRVRLPFVPFESPKNLITKFLKFPKIVDCPNSMTYLPDYVRFIAQRVQAYEEGKPGDDVVFHAVNPEPLEFREVIKIMEEYVGPLNKEFISIEEANAMSRVPRANCVLTEGVLRKTTEEALREAIGKYTS